MQKEIRQPIQKRSIQTKRKIVEAGYMLFAKNGFHKTNTVQIAKKAGVSTGIIYDYFKNKKDILNEVLDYYIKSSYSFVFELLDNLTNKENPKTLIIKILDLAEVSHRNNYYIHNVFNSISQVDKEVNKAFMHLEEKVTKEFVEKLSKLNYKNVTNENVHLAMNLVQTYVHEVVYDRHDYIDYKKMKNSVVALIEILFVS